jgi:uncharacterized protein YecE (DUF72 family)
MTPGEFQFAAKLNRFITHYQKLKSCEKQLEADKVLLDGLGGKLAVVLAQLPPSFPADVDVLKGFLEMVKSGVGSWIPRLAVEFRHPSWLTEEVYGVLNAYGVGICLADWGAHHVTRANEASFVYIRRHSGWENGNYSRQQILGDAEMIRGFLREGKIVYLYYNNDANAYAVRNAREIVEAMGESRE